MDLTLWAYIVCQLSKLMVERRNFSNTKRMATAYKRTMSSGEGVMLNDKTIFHYTSPINLSPRRGRLP